jgi:6-phospho-beta-glucosidase
MSAPTLNGTGKFMVKFTVLGGSSVAVPELISAIIPHIHSGRELEVVLHGRDAHKLELVAQVCKGMAESISGLTVEATTDVGAALNGAQFVLNQVRVGGLAARAYDETFPHQWDIPGEETVGPGGAANAMRTIPVVLELCRAIEQHAPHATLMTFSNPSSVVQRAIALTTRLNVIGLCDAPYTMHNITAKSLGVARSEVDTQYVGMHHFGWITSAMVKGAERLSDVLADDAACNALGIEPAIGRALGVMPHPYFKYFFHPDRMLKKQKSTSQPRAKELQQIEGDLLKVYEAYSGTGKPEAVNKRSAIWYEAVVVPVLMALAFQQPAHLAVNVANGALIPDLPRDTIIEISAAIENGVIHTPTPRRLPPPAMMGMLSANAAYEQTLVEAILKDSPDLLLEAFLINPLISSYDVAKVVVEELWPRRGWPEADAS